MQNLINTLRSRLSPASGFLSPFSLEESIARLRGKQGIYSGVDVKVRMKVMDTDKVHFQMNALQGGWDGVKMELAGRLHRQGEAATQVVIEPARGNERRLYLAAFMIIALLLFAAINGGMMAVVIFGSAFSASWLFTSRKEDELTRLVREALQGQQPG
jgi:hypothetical protein